MGRDRRGWSIRSCPTCFNPRARVGRDVMTLDGASFHWVFQSTRPRGARLISCWKWSAISVFQSTRPRGARRRSVVDCPEVVGVSIHAPAWGATIIRENGKEFGDVSIHAPAWGATRHMVGTRCGSLFQSTRPRGARLERIAARVFGFVFQSTRPRGARLGDRSKHLVGVGFQSTRPRGARHDSVGFWLAGFLFQSTRPRGARRPKPVHIHSVRSFNPRARVGRDRVRP